ncbi:MAG: integrase catalytic subunit, partial [Candidatus Magnetoglobus multicellularis str. Araruama]
VRIHTDAGEEGQVDFGYAGYTLDNAGKRRKTWIFNMKLSYSRYDYYEKVYDQKVVTFIRCHQRAFEFFKGVPKTVRIDNLKAAVLEANFYEPRFQRVYKQFSEHYQFEIIPCRIYRPNDKGKVESGIKYVKNNFFAGRKFKNEDDLNQQLKEWVKQKCNVRIHGTTKKIPQEVFLAQEKEKLISLPESRFKIAEVGLRKVYHDCHIFVESNYYSVPFDFVGCNVDIELSQNVLKIFYEHSLIAVHERLKGKGEFRTNPSHYPKYKVMTEKEYQSKYQKQMIDLGNYAQQIFPIIVKEQPHHWARTVQGILSLSKKYSKEIVDLACKRAISFNVYKYQVIKNICSNASYKLPIESETEVAYYEFPKN